MLHHITFHSKNNDPTSFSILYFIYPMLFSGLKVFVFNASGVDTRKTNFSGHIYSKKLPNSRNELHKHHLHEFIQKIYLSRHVNDLWQYCVNQY